MSERSDDALLAKLRAAEIKMGLVHTLVSAATFKMRVAPCISFGRRVIVTLGRMYNTD
jgi:hypothetical protein